MLWRACRLLHPVQRQSSLARCHNAVRWFATNRTFSSIENDSDDGPSSSADGKRPLALGPRAPILRASELLDDSKPVPFRAQKGQIAITGIVRSIRKQKHACFVAISDGSTMAPIQAVLNPELVTGLTNGAFVEMKGNWVASPAKGQSHELQATAVKIHGPSDPETYPVQKKYQTNEYLRTIPHLRMRTPFNSVVNRLRAEMLSKMHRFLDRSPGFHISYQVHPPLITSSDCEGAGEVFTVAPRVVVPRKEKTGQGLKTDEQPYFKEPKYLTVSSQLHLEAFCAEMGHVWALSPTFRAEPSDTPRHLSEFYMYEAELRGVQNLQVVMIAVQNGIKLMTSILRTTSAGKELLGKGNTEEEVHLNDRWFRLIVGDWRIITYTQAMNELVTAFRVSPSLFQHPPTWESGLQLEHEKWIVSNLGDEKPIFVTDYPKLIKPFYMLPSKTQETGTLGPTVACFDLLFPFGYCELAGGSLREHRLEHLIQNMRERGMLTQNSNSPVSEETETASSPASNYPFLEPGEKLGSLRWYADLRRYGSSPHGGFGLGFDRLLAYLTGVSNVRDVVPFPRTWGRADC